MLLMVILLGLQGMLLHAIFKGRHYVDVRSMFPRVAYGISYAPIRRGIVWKMVLLLVHQ
jgi:hypothetical protein